MSNYIATAVAAGAVSAVVTPLVLALLIRIAPPTNADKVPVPAHRQKFNRAIEVSCFCLIFLGLTVPFVIEGSYSLEPTLRTAAFLFSSFGLFPSVGVFLLSALTGDPGARQFFLYCSQKNNISAKFLRTWCMFTAAVCTTVFALLLTIR